MSKWGLVRIDDRLIHGQVMAIWTKHINVKRIIILDDQVAKDAFMQQVLKLAAPTGIKVDVMDVESNIQLLNDIPNKEQVLLLMKTPKTAKRLKDAGLEYDALNVGGIGMAPGRKNVYKNISMSEEELNTLKDLHANGVTVTLLTVPGEKSKSGGDL